MHGYHFSLGVSLFFQKKHPIFNQYMHICLLWCNQTKDSQYEHNSFRTRLQGLQSKTASINTVHISHMSPGTAEYIPFRPLLDFTCNIQERKHLRDLDYAEFCLYNSLAHFWQDIIAAKSGELIQSFPTTD